VSGSIAVLYQDGALGSYSKTPTKECLNYTKKKAWMRRVDFEAMRDLLWEAMGEDKETYCLIERPMLNPMRWKATVSAIRCLEATEILLELLHIKYEFIDSKEWQKVMLPKKLKGDELKKASDQVVKRLFPSIVLKEPGDGDSLLIAEYARRKFIKGKL
jgi:hypothetical protein